MYLIVINFLLYYSHLIDAIRPAFEDDPERCPFVNRIKINDVPAEMTPKIPGMKYFRRTNDSKEQVSMDKATSLCRMYNLEPAEILDQDDYNEVISIVKETGWSFWISTRGKYAPEFGNYNFDFVLADGHTKIGFHDFGPQDFPPNAIQIFGAIQEACIVVQPNTANPSGVSWSKQFCTERHNILCQYQKSCYRRSDYMKDPTRPIRRLIPIPLLTRSEDSGFYISMHQAIWPFAKQVCEDADMQLLWFEDDMEQDELRNLLISFRETLVQYQGKTFWTAGRFSPNLDENKTEIYSKLYWWKHRRAFEVSKWDLNLARLGQPESSGGFMKKWGKDREATNLDKIEPYDEGLQGVERCVDARFRPDGAEYYTSKCDKSLRFFICKKPEVVRQSLNLTGATKPSFIEYCDDKQYRKTRGKDCKGEILFPGDKKPKCTCYNGVHAFMADIRCKPRLLVGSGCTKLKAKSTIHWQILPTQIISNNKPWIIVAHSHSTDDKNKLFTWFSVNVEEPQMRQVLGATTFFFYGFDVYRDTGPGNPIDNLCFVVNSNTNNASESNEFYEYSVLDLPSITMRHYNHEESCGMEKVPEQDLTTHKVSEDENDCELEPCERKEVNDDSWEVWIEVPHTMVRRDCSDGNDTACNDIHENVDEVQPISNKSALAGKAEGDIEDVNDNLNRQLLINAIEMAFPHSNGPGDSARTGPINTWIIMDKVFELAKQTCNKMVSNNFLSRVLKYFKIVHYGENYEYGEYFSASETRQILSMLDSCRERAYSVREMDVEVDTCTGQASRITLENKTREIISRSADDTGYQAVFHHHVIEATWDVIDLWNVVCINEFKPSYLLFHHMERGLEILFTEKIRKLWHFPNVTEEYFEKLLGPDEGIQLLNLDQCVLSAYKGNMRTNRMNRPFKGRNTVVGQMIRNRLETKKLKEDGVVPTNPITHPNSKVLSACIKGTTVRCHQKQKKIKEPVGALGDLIKRG